MRNKALIINLIGGPGSGKSTTAAGLFYKLKKLGYNCEMSLEFAKDKVMDDQIYIFGKQYHIPYQKIVCEEAVNRIVDIIRANK